MENHLLASPTPEAFRAHLAHISRAPHPFGSAANVEVGAYIAEVMHRAGLQVETHDYDVYVPQPGEPPYVALVTPVRIPLNNQEYILKEDRFSAHPDLTPGWVAYSGSGDVTAQIVYVNYGRKEDFDRLRDMGISLQGNIALARYGMNFRGYKVKYAQAAGAVGVLMYSDPADMGYAKGLEYPEGRFAGESAIQRGSLLTLPYPGDPLTPLAPALPDAMRLNPADVALPKIPAAPLPYASAVEILKRMTGTPVPVGWQGGLPFAYRTTGGPDVTVRLKVAQSCNLTRARNVIGTIQGTQEPDAYVMLGCHYDAWTFGAADPNSGTAMLLTLSEALGACVRNGHRPRRTIRIAHWDAEEYGIIGSTEWVEHHRADIMANAIAYINADMAATGTAFGAAASPLLKGVITSAAQAVSAPEGSGTVYDAWKAQTASTGKPLFGNLGGGSDHMPFYMHAGVPSAAPAMSGNVPVYHSAYDDMAWYERFGDPTFEAGPAMARINGLIALRLSNADLLPYSVDAYAGDVREHLDTLEKRANALSVAFDVVGLRESCTALARASAHLSSPRVLDAPTRDAINRKLIGLERAWLHPEGLQERQWFQSLFGSEDPFEGYASWMLPGLRWEIEHRCADGLKKWTDIYENALRKLTGEVAHIGKMMGMG